MKNCENCANWQFPTKAVYQGLHTKGYCLLKWPSKETYPDETCIAFSFDAKTAELHKAAQEALQASKRERFGEEMNKPATTEDLLASIDKLSSNKQIEARINDQFKLIHKQTYRLVYMHPTGNGVKQIVCAKPDNTLIIFDTDQWEFQALK